MTRSAFFQADHESTTLGISKRIVDVGASLALGVLTAPVASAIALSSAIAFRAKPFFVQTRLGRGGRPFQLVKFRSLPTTTDPTADKYALKAVKNSRFGRFIRRTHVDELPQLWLVAKGTMSLVGPRPEMVHLTHRFCSAQADAHARLRPGVTGLWQISVGCSGLMSEAPEYDVFYGQHTSLALDAWILWKTVHIGLFGGSNVSLGDVPSWAGGGSQAIRAAYDAVGLDVEGSFPVA